MKAVLIKVLIALAVILLMPIWLPLVLLLILFMLVPIKYRAVGTVGRENHVNVKISYLLKLFFFEYAYNNEESKFNLRIAWYKPNFFGELDEINKPKKKKKSATAKKSSIAKKSFGRNKKEKLPDESEPEKKFSIKEIKQKINRVLTYPHRKTMIDLAKKLIKKIYHSLKPKKIKIHGVVGFADPCTTGYFIGAYETVAAFFGIRNDVCLAGSFNEPVVDIDFEIQGKIRIFSLVRHSLWFARQKPIRTIIIQQILKGDDETDD